MPNYADSIINGDPYADIVWTKRDVKITSQDNTVVFFQPDVEAPEAWSDQAVTIVASKYFRGKIGTEERETSVRQLIDRVAETISKWGASGLYFAPAEAVKFERTLKWLLVHQYASFNSPVWFNVGIEKKPQASACFIVGIEDTMESILDTCKTEGTIFKNGSGSGVNMSSLRSSRESLSGGGRPSGPVSFMKGLDAFAGIIKSGGKTRRAAVMRILDVDHPDILEFINCKRSEEEKAHALIDAGYDGAVNGEAYSTVAFQNSNNSVRVTDDFMRRVENNAPWWTHAVTDRAQVENRLANDIFREIAEAAWACGDPGMQFDDTINAWHTCPSAGRQRATNPCSEYCWIDNSSCNLASLNLVKFLNGTEFNTYLFKTAISVMTMAQEIIVGNASYPTEAIEMNTHKYRTLGLGYCNLGALLMLVGLPYDSEAARRYAAAITSLMTAQAYHTSSVIAETKSAFVGYNYDHFSYVINKHMAAHRELAIVSGESSQKIYDAASEMWRLAKFNSELYGVRNAQVTLLAPTGTIGFMMDADTTGIEPAIALVAYKRMSDGGVIKIVNKSVRQALKNLGVSDQRLPICESWIARHGTLRGLDGGEAKYADVFDTALGEHALAPMAHVNMMAAVQPFLSGAISKTVNMPNSATVEDIEDIYMQSWKKGLKCVAVYRDGCKRSQPLNVEKKEVTLAGGATRVFAGRRVGKTDAMWGDFMLQLRQKADGNYLISKAEDGKVIMLQPAPAPVKDSPQRRRMPKTRQAITHKFSVGGHEGYLTVGLYEDGTPGELFLTMSKAGSTLNGMLDAFAIVVSHALQYGVPLDALVDKLSYVRFDPAGMTGNPDIRFAQSIVDYVFRWLQIQFTPNNNPPINDDPHVVADEVSEMDEEDFTAVKKWAFQTLEADGPPCNVCGAFTVRAGTCHTCPQCGETTGCS